MSGALPVVLFTLKMAATSTLVVLPAGILLSWSLSGRRWPGRLVVEALVSLPLVLPPTAVGFGLLVVLHPEGPFGGLGTQIVFTWKAVVLAGAVVGLPLLVASFRHALEAVDPALVGVARTLGRGPWQVFFEIQLPIFIEQFSLVHYAVDFGAGIDENGIPPDGYNFPAYFITDMNFVARLVAVCIEHIGEALFFFFVAVTVDFVVIIVKMTSHDQHSLRLIILI